MRGETGTPKILESGNILVPRASVSFGHVVGETEGFVIFISAAHSFFVSQWKNSNFLVRPELLVNDILRRVALGMYK